MDRGCRGAACKSRQRCAPPLADFESKPGGIRGIWRGIRRYELSFSGGLRPLIWPNKGMFASGPGAQDRRKLRKSLPANPLSTTCFFHVLVAAVPKTRFYPPNRDFHGFRNFTNRAVVRAWSPAMYSKRHAEPPLGTWQGAIAHRGLTGPISIWHPVAEAALGQ